MIKTLAEWTIRSVLFYIVFGVGMMVGSAVATTTLWGMGICYL